MMRCSPCRYAWNWAGGLYVDLNGAEYLEDFLLLNFKFHQVTTYVILRMAGVPVGKRDYMLHLLPQARQQTA